MSAKTFPNILKAYMMKNVITKFRSSSFSQSEVKVGRGVRLLPPTPPKNEVQKAHSELVLKRFQIQIYLQYY